MGILKSGILGPMQNKTGSAIGRMHRNINVITGPYRKTNKPATAAQLDVQAKLGMLSSFLNAIDDLIKPGFKQYAKGEDPVNVASSFNYQHAFIKDEAGLRLNYAKLVYSRGYILGPESSGLLALPNKIEFNWLPQRQSKYCQYTDMATVMVYNPVKERFIKLKGVAERYAQGCLFDIPPHFAGDTVHCYISFASKDGKLQGNSTYLGELLCI